MFAIACRQVAMLRQVFQQRRARMVRRFNLDTYKLVLHLERNGFSRKQASVMMRGMNDMVQRQVDAVQCDVVSKLEAENETYQYRVSLHDLKTELSTLRKTETAALQSATFSIQRDLDILSLKFREDFNTLKSDIQLEMNSRKAELKEERQKNDAQIQEISHQLSNSILQLRTEMETMKLQLLTKWASDLIGIAGIALGVSAGIIVIIKLI